MKENNILLHIPHAHPQLHDDMGEVLVDYEILNNFSSQISDLMIDELFTHDIGVKYIAPYSRVFCDVEKFLDESQEVMSKYGQGVFYTLDSDGNAIRNVSQEYKERITKDYYIPYHEGLDELTISLLDKKLIIVDCHSYFENCVLHNKSESYTDICLGFDEQYYSKRLVDGVKTIFENQGYSVSYNKPYKGTLIPNAIYDKKIPKVFCLMIEINKRVYLQNEILFKKCKDTIKLVLEYIRAFN